MGAVAVAWLTSALAWGQVAIDEPPPRTLAGTWVGSCEIDGQARFLRLKLDEPGGLGGTADVRALGVGGADVSTLRATDDHTVVSFRTPSGRVRLTGQVDGEHFRGAVEQARQRGLFSLRRRQSIDERAFDPLIGNYQPATGEAVLVGRWDSTAYLFLAEGDRRIEIVPVGAREFVCDDLRTLRFECDERGSPEALVFTSADGTSEPAPRVQLYDEQEVTFDNDNVRLAGSLVVPPGPGPFPALVFVHGSGPQTRESYRLAADRFARGGVACLFYDKRGTGDSSGDWRTADFDVLAADALAGVKLLQHEDRIAPDQVGLWGVSQAGWIIPLAAAESDDVAFIIAVSGATAMPVEEEAWRCRNNLRYLGVGERFIEVGRKAAVMVADWHRRQQTGRTPLHNPFAHDELNLYHDGEAVLSKVRQPALVIYGELDTLGVPQESAHTSGARAAHGRTNRFFGAAVSQGDAWIDDRRRDRRTVRSATGNTLCARLLGDDAGLDPRSHRWTGVCRCAARRRG